MAQPLAYSLHSAGQSCFMKAVIFIKGWNREDTAAPFRIRLKTCCRSLLKEPSRLNACVFFFVFFLFYTPCIVQLKCRCSQQ